MSLFQGIETLRGQLDAVVVQIRFLPDGQLRVITSPQLSEEQIKSAPHLGDEFVVQGSAQELDAGYATQFMQPIAASRASLVAQAEAAVAAAAKSAQATAAKKAPAGAKPANSTKVAAPAAPAVSGESSTAVTAKDAGGDIDAGSLFSFED
jgi:PRTRC genetic system protein E